MNGEIPKEETNAVDQSKKSSHTLRSCVIGILIGVIIYYVTSYFFKFNLFNFFK